MAAGASDGETTTQKPVPMLKVANIVAAGTRPALAISAKTGGAGGSAPSSYDTTMFGHVANVMAFPADGAVAKYARSKANLASYVDRIKTKYWATPDAKPAKN